MQTIEARTDEFVKLLKAYDEKGCLEYIDKYDGFYSTIDTLLNTSMLQMTCTYKLSQVAKALIDKNCDLTHRNIFGHTALMYASCFKLSNVTTYIIDNLVDVMTRVNVYGISEMMYLCENGDANDIVKMIDRGYDIYYKTDHNQTLFTIAIRHCSKEVVGKLIDVDMDFANQFKTYCEINGIEPNFYNTIMKHINDKRDSYKHEIIATMNDVSPINMLYQSFHTTYAVELVDVICDFILLKM
ncbi:MAG: hypothetical protein Faunusvirus64_2 [Faunusvirus sp.]|jgi:hypothetical protein|uniref:Uncharacterized protein n=1 Tax=Faunusvirus sp. TaxID=2487766 RepID=A0A3G5A2Z3_9VIRU|nr:MAG: hypothetical protein Faunusvirus64_2 [Faunusvirus sp.]